jgi:hypothetical protein
LVREFWEAASVNYKPVSVNTCRLDKKKVNWFVFSVGMRRKNFKGPVNIKEYLLF